jgi:hypothetical protein
MRVQTSLVSIFSAVAAAAFVVAGWNGGLAGPTLSPLIADNRPNAIPVDTELVLAVDVSYSMDPEEQALQREGYIAGLTSREFIQALKGGMHGKVAVTYFEWAGPGDQRIVMPWRLIDGPEAADAAAAIQRALSPRRSPTYRETHSIRQALFDASGYHGLRRVIGVSGDGQQQRPPAGTDPR